MSDPLRDLATRRWRQNAERQMRREWTRRLFASFFFGLGATLLVAISAEMMVQWVAQSSVEKIEKGLQR